MLDLHEMTILVLIVINTVELFFLFNSWRRISDLEKLISLIEIQQKLDSARFQGERA